MHQPAINGQILDSAQKRSFDRITSTKMLIDCAHARHAAGVRPASLSRRVFAARNRRV
jgi:hypothetical protein